MSELTKRLYAAANDNTRRTIADELSPMFEEAERKGLWFTAHYQDIWFSPSELIEMLEKGSFWWGATIWQLRDPAEYLKEAESSVRKAQENFKYVQEHIAKANTSGKDQ